MLYVFPERAFNRRVFFEKDPVPVLAVLTEPDID
jgi:hypothetical protein